MGVMRCRAGGVWIFFVVVAPAPSPDKQAGGPSGPPLARDLLFLEQAAHTHPADTWAEGVASWPGPAGLATPPGAILSPAVAQHLYDALRAYD